MARTPSAPQLKVLLAAARAGGQLPTPDRAGRTAQACARHGWLTDTGRLTDAGRDAARLTDPDGYARAIPAHQLDTELERAARFLTSDEAREARQALDRIMRLGRDPRCLGAVPEDRPAPAASGPAADTVQYDVSPERAPEFVGYRFHVGTELEILARVEPRRGGTAARLYIADGHGGTRCVGTAYEDFPVYGPAGGPDLSGVAAAAIQQGTDPAEHAPEAAHQAPAGADRAAVAAAMTGLPRAALGEQDRALIAAGIHPHTRQRLYPPVRPDLAADIRPRAAYVRDHILAAADLDADGALPGWSTAGGLAGDPCAPGYRLHVHAARKAADLPEAVRRALLHLEIALTSGAQGYRGMALAGLAKATAILGVAPYGGKDPCPRCADKARPRQR